MDIRIYNVGGYIVKNYLLQTPAGWIAVDTGYPGGETAFLQRFQKLARLEEMKYVFLRTPMTIMRAFSMRCCSKRLQR